MEEPGGQEDGHPVGRPLWIGYGVALLLGQGRHSVRSPSFSRTRNWADFLGASVSDLLAKRSLSKAADCRIRQVSPWRERGETGKKKKKPDPFMGSGSSLVAQDAHDLVAWDLDQVAAAEGLDQAGRLVDQGPQVGGLDPPALGQLADQELGVGVDQEAVFRRALVRAADAAQQVLQAGDEGPVLGLVRLLPAVPRGQAVGAKSGGIGRAVPPAAAIDYE